MFDMGPYYVTALLNLLGPIRRLSGLASVAIPERTITSQPNASALTRPASSANAAGSASASTLSRAWSMATRASPSSTSWKCGEIAASSGNRRNRDWQNAWIVDAVSSSSLLAASDKVLRWV